MDYFKGLQGDISCTSVEQSLFKQILTEIEFALVYLSCEEVTVFLNRRVL